MTYILHRSKDLPQRYAYIVRKRPFPRIFRKIVHGWVHNKTKFSGGDGEIISGCTILEY